MSDDAARRRNSERLGLLAILAVALVLRLVGLDWALPGELHRFSYHPDEWQVVETALTMLANGDPNPHFFNYPTLQIYLATLLLLPATAGTIGTVYLLCRLLTVAFGLATIVLTWRLARAVEPALGLLAAGLLAVLPLHVVNSHFATVDVPLAFWSTAALACAVAATRGEPVWRWALLGGLMIGLAASTKYNGALALLPLWVGLGLGAGRRAWGPALAAGGAALLAFGLTSPFVLLDPAALPALRFELFEHPGGTAIFGDVGPGWWFHLRWNLPTATGTLFAAAALLGAIRLRRERAAWPLLVWLALVLLSLLRTRELFIRYWLPLLPVLAIFAGAALLGLRDRRAWLAVVVALVITGPLLRSRGYAVLLSQPDARDRAAVWAFRTLPPGTRVGVAGGPWFWSVPLHPNNGGARTGASPEQGPYPLRTAPDDWAADPPTWLLLNRTHLQEADPTIDAALAAGELPFVRRETWANEARVLPGWAETGRGSRLHDWNYILPVIEAWSRTSGQ